MNRLNKMNRTDERLLWLIVIMLLIIGLINGSSERETERIDRERETKEVEKPYIIYCELTEYGSIATDTKNNKYIINIYTDVEMYTINGLTLEQCTYSIDDPKRPSYFSK